MNNLPSFIEAEETRIQILSSGILDVLPDVADRVLLCDAVVYRCDCFCTFDKKTILKHREILKALPVEIMTPSEWWEKFVRGRLSGCKVYLTNHCGHKSQRPSAVQASHKVGPRHRSGQTER
jgi:hypothetical protein